MRSGRTLSSQPICYHPARMAKQLHKLGILAKRDDPRAAATLRVVVGHLAPRGVRLLAEDPLAGEFPEIALGRLDEAEAVIVIGGDGTMLHAARMLAPRNVPLVGVNAGRLGFLADIPESALQQSLDALLAGDYTEEPRWLVRGEVLRGEESVWHATALNEVVVQKCDAGRLIEFETRIDGSHVSQQRADGIIVTTPTGSTAYALSAGGPILHPRLDAIAVVPICPHTLSDRPIVVDGKSCVEIKLRETENPAAQVILDGQDHCLLAPGDRVRIQRDGVPARLLHPAGHDYYQVLRQKLHWGRDHESGLER